MLVGSCADILLNSSARDKYQKEYAKKQTSGYASWDSAYIQSLHDSVQVTLPYTEKGQYFKDMISVYSYNIGLKEGEVLHAEVMPDSTQTKIFLDLYITANDSLKRVESHTRIASEVNKLVYEAERTTTYKLIVQPEISAQTPFSFAIYTLPAYHFPVAGVGNRAIQSFWGAMRDKGRRHEGIDIFAPRGTPVVAVTKGRISFAGERGNGGKQVWLRAGMFGKSLYYAHLDSITVSATDRVNIGDTLGFVGNTGNAITTSPHLHFGIYAGGPIDPLPFVYAKEVPKFPPSPRTWDPHVVVQATAANLRSTASVKGEKIGEVRRMDTLQVLGMTGEWWHVKAPGEMKAFIHRSLAK